MKLTILNAKALMVVIPAAGCIALMLLWPQWRNEVQAHEPPSDCVTRAQERLSDASDTCRRLGEQCGPGLGCFLQEVACHDLAVAAFAVRLAGCAAGGTGQ
jgi:hypothetical protein